MSSEFFLRLLDVLLFSLHIIVILFNLLGWIWKKTLKLHLTVILLTAASWFILGIWYGWGYCFLTDWEWEIKYKLGEYDLPNSFITYFFQVIHLPISESTANALTLTGFIIALTMSLYKNILHYFLKK